MARHFQRLKKAEDVCIALIAFSKARRHVSFR